MDKVARGVTPKALEGNWRDVVGRAVDVAELKKLHAQAVEGGYATPEYMAALSERKQLL
jgi:hypothetical protein